MKNLLYEKGVFTDDKGREYYLDNAKFILIFFVVCAHLFGTMKGADVSYVSATAYGVWNWMNTFHMATFIFISGYFAKRFVKKGYTVQKPITYFLIYLVAQFLFIVAELYWWHGAAGWTIFKAQGSLWFLQCMTIWYLLLPMLDQFKPKYMLIGAILLALVVGYDFKVNDYLSFSRVLVHLPFFMAGYYTDKVDLEKLKKPAIIAGSWVYLILLFVVDTVLGKKVPSKLLTCNHPYSDCDFQGPTAIWWLYRLAFYLVVFGCIAAFLAIVPRCKTFFSKWGSRTLAVYILHRFVYRSFMYYGWSDYFDDNWLTMLGLLAFVILVVVVLSLKPFSIPFDYIQKISIRKSLKERK